MTKSTEATFTYKCRRCGQIQKGLTSSPKNTEQVLFNVICDMPVSIIGGSMFSILELHHCQDGGMGLADLTGYEVRK